MTKVSNTWGRPSSPVEVKATPGQKTIHHHKQTSSLQSKNYLQETARHSTATGTPGNTQI